MSFLVLISGVARVYFFIVHKICILNLYFHRLKKYLFKALVEFESSLALQGCAMIPIYTLPWCHRERNLDNGHLYMQILKYP